jgi:predicted Zn-dependent peptidase
VSNDIEQRVAEFIRLHGIFAGAGGILLAVSGDIDRTELEARLKSAFGGWEPAPVDFPTVPWPDMTLRPAMLYVKKDLAQSVIRMGHLGVTKDNPDLYALRVMDFILGGGGLNSRLMGEIRANQGLAYNVAGYFEIGRRFPGPFLAETETKAASTGRAIALMLDIMDGIRKAPVTEAELTLAKESIVNAFIFGFANAERVVNQRARIVYYGYPDRYLEDYRANIAKVTQADVLRVARRYLHPEKLIKVVVGDAAGFDRPLSAFGEVREIRPEVWN